MDRHRQGFKFIALFLSTFKRVAFFLFSRVALFSGKMPYPRHLRRQQFARNAGDHRIILERYYGVVGHQKGIRIGVKWNLIHILAGIFVYFAKKQTRNTNV